MRHRRAHEAMSTRQSIGSTDLLKVLNLSFVGLNPFFRVPTARQRKELDAEYIIKVFCKNYRSNELLQHFGVNMWMVNVFSSHRSETSNKWTIVPLYQGMTNKLGRFSKINFNYRY